MIVRLGETRDIDSMIALQKANLHDNLTPDQRRNGFVTTPFSEAQIEQLLSECGIFIAEEGDRLLGYAFAGTWDYFSQWPIFPYMVSRLEAVSFLGRRILPEQSFQYGPVCIAADQRGAGVHPALFEEMRKEMNKRFPIGVTFINRANERSYAAHARKLSLMVIDEFEFAGRGYYMLAFDTSRSVIANKGRG
jgi:hypothetical protein